jgi:hypothetical protein
MHRSIALVISLLVVSRNAAADPDSDDRPMARIAAGVTCLVLGAGMLGLGSYGATRSNGGIPEIDRIFRYISYGDLVGGAALATAGAVLLIKKAPQKRHDQKRLAPLLAPARGGAFVGIDTRF